MKKLFPLLIVILALVMSITSFYSIGYILLIVLLSLYIDSVGIFKTFVQKCVLFTLLLTATIPVIGLLCWVLDTPLLALYNQVAFILLSLTLFGINKSHNLNLKRNPFIEKVDLIAIAIAIIPITLLALSYGTAPNRTASLFQLSSEGWDNGSHILMMEADSEANGYVYGPYAELKDKLIEGFNAYPQAWHLTTAHLVNGFGGNRFVPTNPMGVILAYTIATLTWLVVLTYLFTVCMWRFYEHLTKGRSPKISETSILVAASSLVSIVVFLASLMHGFTNYIGTLVYLCLSVAMMMNLFLNKNTLTQNYSLFIIFSLTAILSWFLVLPAFAVAFALLLFVRFDSVKTGLATILQNWKMLTITLLAGFAALLQLYIFQKFSGVGGEDQLNTGSLVLPFDMTGSPLHISHILFGLIIAGYFTFLLKANVEKKTKTLMLAIIIPWLTLVMFVYIYQNITAGQNSYYLTKVVGLWLVAAMIPLGALLATSISKVHIPKPALLSPILSFFLIFSVLLATGQPLYGLNKLFQKHARTTYGTAEKVVEYLPKTTTGKAYIVSLTGRKSYENSREDYHGKLEMRVVHQPLNCTYSITGYISIKTAVKRLEKCADQPYMKDKTIYVLTSPASYTKVKDLNKSNITIIKTSCISTEKCSYKE